jgi:hypothetical protein
LTNSRSRLLGGGRLAVPVPALGAELLTDGGFENWNSATDLTSWTEAIAGTSAVTREASVIHGGTYAVKITTDGSGSSASIAQAGAGVGKWYLITVWAKNGGAGLGRFGLATNLNSATLTTSYAQYATVQRAASNTNFLIVRDGINSTFYYDDFSAKEITLASMFSTRPYGTHVTVKAGATVVAGTRAGVVCNLDSASAPANFVIASVDSAGTARLTQCVAGTYTELISTAVTYVAGAAVEIRRPAGGDIWQLFYNGSQVGTNQTISDAAIKAATLAGLFNSYSGNSLAAFSCVPSA